MKRLLFILSFLPLIASAQTTNKYLPVAGGTFTNFTDLRGQRGTDGIIVSVITRDSIRNGFGDTYGGWFSWCNTCMQPDDNNNVVKATTDTGRWIRFLPTLLTALPAGTYNRLVIDQYGRFSNAYFDTTANYALSVAQLANTGVGLVKQYADNTFQPKGNYLLSEVDGSTTNEIQTLSISGQTLSISSGNSVTIPSTDTTSLSNRINAKQNAGSYLIAEVDGSVTNELQTLSGSGNTVTLSNGGGSYTIPAQAYSSLTGTPTIPAQYNPTAGTGISITGTYPNQTITNTSPGVTYTAGSGININSNSISIAPPVYSTTARTLNTSFKPSATRPTMVSYSVTLTTALALLNLNSSAIAYLEISADGTTWTTINSAGVNRSLSVSITLSLNETSYYNLQCVVPANYFCRIRTSTAGGGTAAFGSGQEVQIL